MDTRTNHRQVTTTAVRNNKEKAMFRKITIAVSGFAIATAVIAATGVPQVSADVRADPLSKVKVFSRVAAAKVLREYPLPGDPHDAGFSFAELYETALAELPEEMAAPAPAQRPALTPAAVIVRPGDPHDDAASWPEIMRNVLGIREARVSGVAAPLAPAGPVNSGLRQADYLPRPGDPHDDLYTGSEDGNAGGGVKGDQASQQPWEYLEFPVISALSIAEATNTLSQVGGWNSGQASSFPEPTGP